MKPPSFRLKVALWTAGFSALVVALFAVGTVLNLYDEQLEAIDLDVQQDLRLLDELSDAAESAHFASQINAEHPYMAVTVLDTAGKRLERSRKFPDALVAPALAEAADRFASLRAADRHWRVLSSHRDDLTLIVAFDLEDADETIHELIAAYGLSLPVVLLAVGFGGWWTAGFALGPILRLTREIEAVRAERLDARVPLGSAEDELHRLASVFNDMLARLERSFRQSQRFAADASHELRTPLMVMQSEVEQALRDPSLGEVQAARLLSFQEEISHLERITENLLLLASLESGRAELRRQSLDLAELLHDLGHDAELLAEAESVSFTAEVTAPLPVQSDPALLRHLLLNMVQNAIRHNQPDGRVELRAQAAAGAIEVRIGNTGAGIPPHLRDRIFERFFQVDASRGRRSGHGLGLSICQEIARSLGGTFTLTPDPPAGWTEFVLTLPRTAAKAE